MSPAVIIFYFCILFIAFYMKRILICCFNFGCLICTSIHRANLSFTASHLFKKKAGILVTKRYFQFCCFKTNVSLERKPARVPHSLLEQRWTLVMISGYCLVLVPYLSSTFPKHGLYIIYVVEHSPHRERWTQCRCCGRPASTFRRFCIQPGEPTVFS